MPRSDAFGVIGNQRSPLEMGPESRKKKIELRTRPLFSAQIHTGSDDYLHRGSLSSGAGPGSISARSLPYDRSSIKFLRFTGPISRVTLTTAYGLPAFTSHLKRFLEVAVVVAAG